MAHIKDGFKGERISILPVSIVDELKRDLLGKELYITDIGYYPHAYSHYRSRKREEVGEYVLIYCVEGEGWFELDGGKKQTVEANQFFILPERKAHTYGCGAKKPWTIYWMHFNGAKAGFFSKGFDRPTEISPNDNSRIKERLNLFDEIFSCMSKGYHKDYLLYATTSLFHFLGSMTIFFSRHQEAGREVGMRRRVRVRQITGCINQNSRKICLYGQPPA